jgi:hypothetical protein
LEKWKLEKVEKYNELLQKTSCDPRNKPGACGES